VTPDVGEPSATGEDPDDTVIEAEVVDDAAGSPDGSEDRPSGGADVAGRADGDGGSIPVTGDEVTRERDEYLGALRRLQADFENYRKQTQRRQSEVINHATGALVEEMLPVLDACDAGIEHGDEGVTAVFTSLLGVLEKAGLERLDPVNEPFDPNAHEAVMHEPASDDESEGPVVVEVLRPGYRWKDRILRAAMVKVRG
jgi:molecular chaperone GrpE